jgi:hypothetical protein
MHVALQNETLERCHPIVRCCCRDDSQRAGPTPAHGRLPLALNTRDDDNSFAPSSRRSQTAASTTVDSRHRSAALTAPSCPVSCSHPSNRPACQRLAHACPMRTPSRCSTTERLRWRGAMLLRAHAGAQIALARSLDVFYRRSHVLARPQRYVSGALRGSML